MSKLQGLSLTLGSSQDNSDLACRSSIKFKGNVSQTPFRVD